MKKIKKIIFKILVKLIEAFAGIIIIIVMPEVKRRSFRSDSVRRKMKYFNPIIKQGMFYKTIYWVARHKPLTDDELNNIL